MTDSLRKLHDFSIMTVASRSPHRQQTLFWNVLVEVKVSSIYAGKYRDRQGLWATRIGIVRAVAASSTIAGWAIWEHLAIIWGVVIACSQILDSIKEFFPHTRRQKAAAELHVILEGYLIDAMADWDAIYSGDLPDEMIANRRQKLQKQHHGAVGRSFPEGLIVDPNLGSLAKDEAQAYFSRLYGRDGLNVGR